MELEERMAIIENPTFGIRDIGTPMVYFEVSWHPKKSALVFFANEKALDFVRENHIQDIRDLEGKPCIIRLDGGIAKFKELFKG